MNQEQLRLEMVQYAHLLHEQGWVANHDGNLSALLSDGNILCTPTAQSKRLVGLEQLIVVDGENAVISGTRRPFSELQLHRAAYKARPEIGCVIHAHPPTATGFAVAGICLDPPFMAEPVVSLGKSIPLVPFFPPKDTRLDDAIVEGLGKGDVLMLANHGVLSVGANFEQAYLRIELLEHLSKIVLVARQLGGVIPLSTELVERLSSKGRPSSSAKGKENVQHSTDPKQNIRSQHINTAEVVAEALRKHK